MIEVTTDYVGGDRGGHRSESEIYGDLRATDGVPIDTKKRHREYMKTNDLSLYGDWNWEKLQKERENIGHTQADHRERVEQLGKMAYEMRQKRRK